MRKNGLAIAVVFVGSLVATCSYAQDEDDFFHLGVIEYEVACLRCHGIDGRGNGSNAEFLDTKPTDLTGITKANSGNFPAERLRTVIDGRALVPEHSSRTMPVWGERYGSLASEAGVEGDAEDEISRRIDALVMYVESIQEP